MLVTWGREDRILPLESAFHGVRRTPQADLHILSDCGHWAQVERKKDFEALVISRLHPAAADDERPTTTTAGAR